MKFENTEVFNFEGALRGMRNPKESWDKSDSFNRHEGMGDCGKCPFFIDGHQYSPNECQKEDELDEKNDVFIIGENDLKLAQSLIKAGSEHRKFMRQIFVSVDITAPLYWWKEFDTYKVGTVSNSCSTMHKLADTPITKECFEMDDFENIQFMGKDIFGANCSKDTSAIWEHIISFCEELRQNYNKLMENKKHLEEIKEFEEAKKAQVMAKKYWKELIRLLPESWLQKRTVTMDYENLLAMCSKGQRRFHKLTEWSKSFIDWARSLPCAQELIFLDEIL